jgi:cation diffusion facilitator family transporter
MAPRPAEQAHGRRSIVAAFLANLGVAAAKVVGFALTGAASLLAEAIHSMADSANQGLLLLGRSRADRPPNGHHPFGFGRERFFWAFVVALMLFSGGSLFALVEGEEKLRHPHELESPGLALAILAVAICLEGTSLRTAIREAAPRRNGSWWRFVRSSRSPELPVVLLEDSAAVVGLMFAAAGIALSQTTGDARFDALGSIAIGILLGVVAIVLAVETKSMLIGESAAPQVREAICRAVDDVPGVRAIADLRTEHVSPDHILVVGDLDLEPDVDPISVIDEVADRLRERVPQVAWSYFEPVASAERRS